MSHPPAWFHHLESDLKRFDADAAFESSVFVMMTVPGFCSDDDGGHRDAGHDFHGRPRRTRSLWS